MNDVHGRSHCESFSGDTWQQHDTPHNPAQKVCKQRLNVLKCWIIDIKCVLGCSLFLPLCPVSDYEGVRRSICAWQEALYPQETHFNLFQLVAGIHHAPSTISHTNLRQNTRYWLPTRQQHGDSEIQGVMSLSSAWFPSQVSKSLWLGRGHPEAVCKQTLMAENIFISFWLRALQ